MQKVWDSKYSPCVTLHAFRLQKGPMLKSAVGSMFLTRPFLVRFQKGQHYYYWYSSKGKKGGHGASRNPIFRIRKHSYACVLCVTFLAIRLHGGMDIGEIFWRTIFSNRWSKSEIKIIPWNFIIILHNFLHQIIKLSKRKPKIRKN